jgi:hypothetical protein
VHTGCLLASSPVPRMGICTSAARQSIASTKKSSLTVREASVPRPINDADTAIDEKVTKIVRVKAAAGVGNRISAATTKVRRRTPSKSSHKYVQESKQALEEGRYAAAVQALEVALMFATRGELLEIYGIMAEALQAQARTINDTAQRSQLEHQVHVYNKLVQKDW